jgi:hypothetical protein
MLQVQEIAVVIGRSADWVRRVANDMTKHPKERQYPPEIHAAFPPLKKMGRTWVIWGPKLQSHLEKLSRKS